LIRPNRWQQRRWFFPQGDKSGKNLNEDLAVLTLGGEEVFSKPFGAATGVLATFVPNLLAHA
jgi:hypothetical protein